MNEPASPRLIWHHLSKSYSARPVWHHLDGVAEPGDVLVISGPNGSGKSTLLRLFCGLEQPTSGSIHYEIGGQRLAPAAARPLIGVVAPDLALYRELTALENMEFFAAARGLDPDPATLCAGLAAVGLAGRERDHVSGYSSGMALRLKYAVARIHAPPVLILDEPTAMFDEAGRALVEALIAAQRQRGITIIATNDERELAWGDLVLRLQ